MPTSGDKSSSSSSSKTKSQLLPEDTLKVKATNKKLYEFSGVFLAFKGFIQKFRSKIDTVMIALSIFSIFHVVGNKFIACSVSSSRKGLSATSFVEYGCLFSEPNYLQLLVDFMLLLEIAKAFQISIYHCISRGYDVIDADKYLPSTILPDSDEKTRQENIEIYKSMIKDLEQRKKLLSSVKLRIFFGYLLHLFAVAFHIAWYSYFTSRMYSLTGKVHSELYVNYMRYGDSNMLFECEVDYTSQVNIFNSFRSNDNDDSFKEHNDLVKVTCMKTLVPYINYSFFIARILIALQIVSIIIEESFKAYFFADALENRSSDYINDVIYGLANGYYGYYDVKLIATSFKVKDKNEEIGTFKYLKIRGFSSHLMYLPVTDSVDHFENNDPKFDFNVKIPEVKI